jgi:hypothetical protein
MLHAVVMILALASVVLALLIMVQVISVKDLLSFTRRGLVTVVVLLVVGCLLKQLVVTVVASVLLPIARVSLLWSLVALLAIIALFFIIRLLMVTADSRRNT